jgi:hypothetical protein
MTTARKVPTSESSRSSKSMMMIMDMALIEEVSRDGVSVINAKDANFEVWRKLKL